MQILANLAADGSSSDFAHSGFASRGHMNVYVGGGLGGGTLTLEAKLPDGSGYVPLQTFTATGLSAIEAAPFAGRFTLAGSTTPSLSVWVEFDSAHTRDAIETR